VEEVVLSVLRCARIFQPLSPEALERVAERLEWRYFDPEEALMQQGDASDAMYIIGTGRVRVERIDEAGAAPVLLAELGIGEVVGEMGVLDGERRSATVAAIDRVSALRLGTEPLMAVMVSHPEVAEALRHIVSQRLRDTDALVGRMFADLLRKAAIFQPVSQEAIDHLAERGQRRRFFAGAALMRQGEASSCMYVIADGTVRVERTHAAIVEPVILATLGHGEVVGEMGVLDGAPRSASVLAVDDVEAMELDAAALEAAMLRYPEIASALLHVVTKRMRSTDELLEELFSKQPSKNGTSNHGIDLARDGPVQTGGSER